MEPDYFQFYVCRSGATSAEAEVPEDGYRDRLWSSGGFGYVGTLRKFGTTPLDVTVLSVPPPIPSPEWQHVAEVSLDGGGPLEIQSWSGKTVATIAAPDRPVRVRVSWMGLVAGRFEGMDGDGNSDEQIALAIWGSPLAERVVLRRWAGWPW